ncbi:MAG: DUF4115 domain-containing protein [Hyphomicrobiales bacterium]|nr:DUF4115 domain-containing protein [Hyphomicrobiales bacterium]
MEAPAPVPAAPPARVAAVTPPPASRVTPADTLATAQPPAADADETPPPPPAAEAATDGTDRTLRRTATDADSGADSGTDSGADSGTEVASAPPPPDNLSPGITTQAAAPPLAPEAMVPPAPPPSEDTSAQQYGGSKFRILVRARSDSWIQVRDETGNELIVTRLLRAGDSYRVPDRGDLTLQTGNAGALEILVDGEVVPPIGPEGAVRRRVALSAQRLLDGTAVVE